MPSKSKEINRASAKRFYERNRKACIERSKKARRRRQEYLRHLKETSPCTDCQKFYPYYVMQFDHLYGKVQAVAHLVNSGWNKLKREISKCELVCANCHAVRTWRRLQGAVA